MDKQPDQNVDPERPRDGNAFDKANGYSGQDYHLDRERQEAMRDPSGAVDPRGDTRRSLDASDPPEAGHRASVDPVTGEVHGSGSGAGGGNDGEDYDQDPQNGSGYPRTGAKGESGIVD